MIAFDLKCMNGHTFEGWFEDNRAYDTQKKKGLIACPVCNDTMVSKIPSTFAIKGSQQHVPDKISKQMDLKNIGRDIIDYVDKNFDNVGCDFAKEALKIHYGVTEPRNIRGVSTEEEEKTLEKEGIQFFKIPKLPPSDS
jgi:hypothetical protein